MRILIVHEAAAGGGGVESYLAALMPALLARGHQLAFLHYNRRDESGPTRLVDTQMLSASVMDDGWETALGRVRDFRPDICFSHNMRMLDVDERLAASWPVVKMMHGYFGTCVSGQKAHAFPGVVPCCRELGVGCLALYLPRRCGQLRSLGMFAQYGWAARQRRLFNAYSQVLVASAHMSVEYARHGIAADRLTVAPLFPTAGESAPIRPLPRQPSVLFMGRMTNVKGGAVLVEAMAEANRQSGERIDLILAGEGPERPRLEQMARRRGVAAAFPGWLTGAAKDSAFAGATMIAVPSLWPEPFGLVGLEAAARGVPAVAFDVGGIREWLHDQVNGCLVAERTPRALGTAITELCSNPAEMVRLGHGAQRVARTMTREAHVTILERVFARAVRPGVAIA